MSKKLCLNLCSLKLLRPEQRRVRQISPFGWLTLRILSLRGLIKYKTFFLKTEHERELRIFESNLFQSTNADGKKINEKVIPYFKLGNPQVLTISCLAGVAI